jgi:hypothetical protein
MLCRSTLPLLFWRSGVKPVRTSSPSEEHAPADEGADTSRAGDFATTVLEWVIEVSDGDQ